ncbi:MAG TPA: glycosyltransferase family 2 protein [Chloroflexia bacterium]|nr:glycosyltransferase family 2 protein [Chloroflexia bacterium]
MTQAPIAKPFVSILMPVRNEADFIVRSVGAVLAQDYPAGCMEILIADGMSTDATRALIAGMAACHPAVPITVLDNPAQIAPTGLNVAIAQARGDILIRVDGHCEIAPDYVSRCVAHLQGNATLAGVGGPIETIGDTLLSQTIAIAMSSTFGVGNSTFRTGTTEPVEADTLAFPAYTRAAVELAGPLDEELVRNQDDEYNYRLRELGARLLLAPDVRSRYYSRGSLRTLARQYYQYGYWKVRVMQKHPRQMRARQFAPPALVAGLLGGGMVSLPYPRLRGAWYGIAGLYSMAILVASWRMAGRAGYHHLPWLPVVFPTLHLSYGLGFLVGLLRFAPRWWGPR